MRVSRKTVAVGMTLGIVVAGVVSGTGPADAATPASVCGGGYYEIDHHNLNGAVVHLLYDGSNDCVVTWRNSPGTAIFMGAELKTVADPSWVGHIDSGYFTTYAGPVRRYAPGICIQWGGDANIPPVDPGNISNGYISPPSHCN